MQFLLWPHGISLKYNWKYKVLCIIPVMQT